MRQFLPFNQIDPMKKTQIDIVDPEEINDVYINNLQSFELITILALASRGPEKAKSKAVKLGTNSPIVS